MRECEKTIDDGGVEEKRRGGGGGEEERKRGRNGARISAAPIGDSRMTRPLLINLLQPPLLLYNIQPFSHFLCIRRHSSCRIYLSNHPINNPPIPLPLLNHTRLLRRSKSSRSTRFHHDLRRRPLPSGHLPGIVRHDDDRPLPLPRCQCPR